MGSHRKDQFNASIYRCEKISKKTEEKILRFSFCYLSNNDLWIKNKTPYGV